VCFRFAIVGSINQVQSGQEAQHLLGWPDGFIASVISEILGCLLFVDSMHLAFSAVSRVSYIKGPVLSRLPAVWGWW
jgi:hypothetical protein